MGRSRDLADGKLTELLDVEQSTGHSVQLDHTSTSGYSSVAWAENGTIKAYSAHFGTTDGSGERLQHWVASNAPMTFGTNNTERMRILSSGGITFNGDTAAANALDDYEEGTWTGTLIGSATNPSTPITATFNYTKIGNIVYVNGQFNNVDTTGASGGVRVSGLPFSANPSSQATGNVMDNLTAAWAGSNTANISPYFTGNFISFYASQSAGGWFEITHNPGTGRYLSFSGTYKV